MDADWNALSDDMQLAITRAALRHAANSIAGQAETLAAEMEAGHLADRGGADALRLLAAILRSQQHEALVPVGQG
ncbi:MAG: hypothetical protein KGI51_16510 [Rhodospirillales bacterium]|jgi:hypothetical protein|nr:hypothetical protein [Rhodospirillales bacterium]MDE2581713.1 hypothetical protein [Rhodospirillales bacterium]